METKTFDKVVLIFSFVKYRFRVFKVWRNTFRFNEWIKVDSTRKLLISMILNISHGVFSVKVLQ